MYIVEINYSMLLEFHDIINLEMEKEKVTK